MALCDGYDAMGFEMSKPHLRAELEAELQRYILAFCYFVLEGLYEVQILSKCSIKSRYGALYWKDMNNRIGTLGKLLCCFCCVCNSHKSVVRC